MALECHCFAVDELDADRILLNRETMARNSNPPRNGMNHEAMTQNAPPQQNESRSDDSRKPRAKARGNQPADPESQRDGINNDQESDVAVSKNPPKPNEC